MVNNQKYDARLQSYKTFLDYLYQIGSETTTDDELAELYYKFIDIQFNNHAIHIPFDAVVYNQLVTLLETIIKEY